MTIDPIAAILLFLALIVIELVHLGHIYQVDRETDRLHRLLHRCFGPERRP